MTGLLVPAAAPLAHRRGVELMRVGQWDTASGTWTFTRDDLGAAVAALDCGAIRRPILKLGHRPPHGHGDPAIGWVDNMAISDDGALLTGDYVGMPGWLGSVLSSAYPDRSVEADWDFACQLGHIHPFVVRAVALLGVQGPAIGTLASLQDVAALYGVDLADTEHRGTPVVLTIKEDRVPNPKPATVAAGVTTEDVRRAYYDDAPWELWIEEFHLEPLQLIVLNDNTGTRIRVPVTIGGGDGTDAVTFEQPIPVVIRYDDAPSGVAAAAAPGVVRFATRAESRPGTQSPAPPDGPTTPTTEEGSPTVDFTDDQLTSMRQSLGLDDTADAATLLAAMTEALGERADAVVTSDLPDGTVAIEQAVLDNLQVAAARGEAARAQQEQEERQRLVSAAVADGRIPPARRGHWEAQLAADPGAGDSLAKLAKGLIPVGDPAGYAGGADDEVQATAETIRETPVYKNWSR